MEDQINYFLTILSLDSIDLLIQRKDTWHTSIERCKEHYNSFQEYLKSNKSLNQIDYNNNNYLSNLLIDPLYNKFFNRNNINNFKLLFSNISTDKNEDKKESLLFSELFHEYLLENIELKKKELRVYVSTFTSNYYNISYQINQLYSFLTNSFSLYNFINFKLIVLEDLITLQRAYIHNSKSLKLYNALEEKRNNNFIFISTNELFNSWAEGDVKLIRKNINNIEEDVTFSLPVSEDHQIWHDIQSEVQFEEMMNQGNPVPRLICLQVLCQDIRNKNGDEYVGIPYYRHPHDNHLNICEMTPTVYKIMKSITNEYPGLDLNHVLIQLYRDGNDTIASHSDKTLDINLDTPIFNYSLGATRIMTIQNKKNKNILETIPLRHEECVEFGLKTNQLWWHEIKKQSNLIPQNISKNNEDQNPWKTSRISFTFRKVSTYFCLPISLISKIDKENNINQDLKPFQPGYIFDINNILNNYSQYFPFSRLIIIGQGSPFKTLEDYFDKIIEPSESSSDFSQLISEDITSNEKLIAAFSKQNKQSEEFDWKSVYGDGFFIIN